jgi:hypothetical protein
MEGRKEEGKNWEEGRKEGKVGKKDCRRKGL